MLTSLYVITKIVFVVLNTKSFTFDTKQIKIVAEQCCAHF